MSRLHRIALIPLVACISPPDAPPDLEPIEAKCLACPLGNGAMVAGHPFSWLRLDHEEQDGVKFVEFLKNGAPRPLDIYRNVLRYRDVGGTWRGYKDLVDTVIRVEIAQTLYDVVIADVRNCNSDFPPHLGTNCLDHGIPYYTFPTPPWLPVKKEAETYRLQWAIAGASATLRKEVCPVDLVDETTGGHEFEALMFEGDYYDRTTRNITETDTPTFTAPFNIACVGSLPAKMELSRRTSATKAKIFSTTVEDDRQALARAFSAQYCLNKVFTETGHLLRIRDRRGWLDPVKWGWTAADESENPKFNFEAVWDADGAVCLDKPRLAVLDPNVPIEPGIMQRIEEECLESTPPPCSGPNGQPWFPDNWKDHGQFLTATIAWGDVFKGASSGVATSFKLKP